MECTSRTASMGFRIASSSPSSTARLTPRSASWTGNWSIIRMMRRSLSRSRSFSASFAPRASSSRTRSRRSRPERTAWPRRASGSSPLTDATTSKPSGSAISILVRRDSVGRSLSTSSSRSFPRGAAFAAFDESARISRCAPRAPAEGSSAGPRRPPRRPRGAACRASSPHSRPRSAASGAGARRARPPRRVPENFTTATRPREAGPSGSSFFAPNERSQKPPPFADLDFARSSSGARPVRAACR